MINLGLSPAIMHKRQPFCILMHLNDMNKSLNRFCRFIMFACLLSYGMPPLHADDKKDFDINRNIDIFSNLFKELDRYYVDSIPAEEMVTQGINAMLSHIDPYTTYIPESQREDFETMTTGQYGGIGAIIQQKGDSVLISEPYEGMPAAQVGLRPGDVILAIDSISMVGKTTSQVSAKLKGEPETQFILRIGRKGLSEPLNIPITRQNIQLNAVPYAGMLNDSIGYIFLSNFTDKAAKEVREALVKMQSENNLKGLVFDLRNNPGGILEDAIEILNLFLPKGKTVLETRSKTRNWDRTYKTTRDPIAPDLPLAILINSGSASAAEIVSGALQDLDRAVVIGERSFGKGLVQSTRPVSYNGLLKVTTAKYYIPSGRLIQAIDYRHRNPDGSVGRIPDSLTTVFYTENLRPVRDGGGITPDIAYKPSNPSNLLMYLIRDQLIFDFANDYAATHTSIGDIHTFQINDTVYQDFVDYVKAQKFTYDRESLKALERLKELAQFEGYATDAKDAFDMLEKKLEHNIDHDLQTFREEVQQYLEQEIARRYYYQKGEIIQILKTDKTLDKALEILENKVEYKHILAPPAKK